MCIHAHVQVCALYVSACVYVTLCMYERKYTYTPQTAIARIRDWKVEVTALDPGIVRADPLFIYSTFLLRSLSGSHG